MARQRRKSPAKPRPRKSAARKQKSAPRAGDVAELQDQLAATAEVLGAISSPTFELRRVLDSMTSSAARLCKASDATILLLEGDQMVFGSHFGAIPVDFTSWKVTPNWTGGRAVLDRKTVHVRDMTTDKGFPEGNVASARMGYRTILTVPMMHGDRPMGALTLRRTFVRPFTAKQVSLAESFATQAVIAIENARLINDLRESLDQQAATFDVVRATNSSPGNLEAVFKVMLENAVRICEAKFGNLLLYDGRDFRIAARISSAPARWLENQSPITRPGPNSPIQRVVATKQTLHIADIRLEQSYLEKDPAFVGLVDVAGVRTLLLVPLVKDGEVIGAIGIHRQEVAPFSARQIALTETFAAQAVIAIENARLLSELRARTEELRQLNGQLEQRVSDQVGEIGRISRLRRFLPPQVADLIVSSGAEKQLESHRREITALFCDLRGFTAFAEAAEPDDLMALLREYHAAIGRIIFKYGGTLERFVGDGVMVIFNDPIPLPNPSLHAVQMALEMRAGIGALVENWHRLGREIGFGIGIEQGLATLGTIGFEGRFDYSAIGTVSNVASRLCDEAKPGQILISGGVLAAVQDAVTVEPQGELALKGIRRPLEVFNVLGARAEPSA
jgi:class 3 adenylate cyclase/putative methionine-R-sulfoxide reductase with GAF domain